MCLFIRGTPVVVIVGGGEGKELKGTGLAIMGLPFQACPIELLD